MAEGTAASAARESAAFAAAPTEAFRTEPRTKLAAPLAGSVAPRANNDLNTARYSQVTDNSFLAAASNPLSTFSIDVDTASYANVRRFLESSTLPPKDAVRVEEMINYFSYDYPPPDPGAPFSVHLDAASCPWQPAHRLVRIGLRGRETPNE